MTFGLKFLNRDIKAPGDGVSWLLLQSWDSSPFVPSYHLKMAAHAQLSLTLLNRKEAEYWNALSLHHCVSITYLLDLFPLSCNLAFALSLLSPSPRTRLAYCPCSRLTDYKGWNNHRAQSIEMFCFVLWSFQAHRGGFLVFIMGETSVPTTLYF